MVLPSTAILWSIRKWFWAGWRWKAPNTAMTWLLHQSRVPALQSNLPKQYSTLRDSTPRWRLPPRMLPMRKHSARRCPQTPLWRISRILWWMVRFTTARTPSWRRSNCPITPKAVWLAWWSCGRLSVNWSTSSWTTSRMRISKHRRKSWTPPMMPLPQNTVWLTTRKMPDFLMMIAPTICSAH